MTKEAALYKFWSGFGIPAYEENTVPTNANFPYITYQVVVGSFGNGIMLTASVYYRSESWNEINEKTREIQQAMKGNGGSLHCDGGGIRLLPEQQFAQNMGDESDDMIRRKYLSYVAYFNTTD